MISGPLGIAEIEIVGGGQRQRAGGRQVAPAFGHRLLAALEGIGLAIAGRDVAGEGQRLGPWPSTRTTPASPPGRCSVLPWISVSYCSQTQRREERFGAGQQLQQRLGDVIGAGSSSAERRGGFGRHPGPVIFRRLVAQFLDRQVGHFDLALMQDAEAQVVGGLADDGEVEAPFAEDRLGLGLLFGPQHHEHALLAFRQHHLVGAHASSRTGTRSRSSSMPRSPLAPISTAEQVRPGRAHVLDGDDGARRHQFEAGFQQAASR
jgi:hypothetical protein